MATAPAPFSRFLADNINLVIAIFERGGVDEAELLALCERHRGPTQPSAEYVRRQLVELGFIERAAYAENAFELWHPVQDLLTSLTRRHRLSSASVLGGYFDELQSIEHELSRAVHDNNVSDLLLVLPEAQRLIARIRELSAGNRESIVTEAQKIRSASEGVSALERVQLVRRLWERYIDPLRQLVEVTGELEPRLDALQATLHLAEHRFLSYGVANASLGRTIPMLARMRRDVRTDHQAAVHEMAPLYERIRRDSRWYRGAAQALMTIRTEGVGALELEAHLGLVGWRPRYLMSDAKLEPRLIALTEYRPEGAVFLSDPPPPVVIPFINRDELQQALASAVPVDDVLSFVLSTWPDHPVRSQLTAYGQVVAGAVGPIEVRSGAPERRYETHELVLVAAPVALREVAL